MNNKKFDGPSFVNPKHTNQGLENTNYQHPTYIPNATQIKKVEIAKNHKKGAKGIANIFYFNFFRLGG